MESKIFFRLELYMSDCTNSTAQRLLANVITNALIKEESQGVGMDHHVPGRSIALGDAIEEFSSTGGVPDSERLVHIFKEVRAEDAVGWTTRTYDIVLLVLWMSNASRFKYESFQSGLSHFGSHNYVQRIVAPACVMSPFNSMSLQLRHLQACSVLD
ncbi:hypothetical protein SELMODRAFT_421937 [Selaginella moellendorffii]|uniref:Uncharacterized protein n=1 Tax=Selaginella moellendorffii TaxID=88036 RepID=D8SGU2_SELML|nr:hypothetical protein SELMODRAFT_421937 [Selaginella moellendorffii]